MEKVGRTAKSIRNVKVRTFFVLLELLIRFFSRRVFLDYLGTEILGLNTTATNILQFLNLAELGVGSAIAVTLYKPVIAKNSEEINELITLQGMLYKRLACVIIAGAALTMLFFPLIFAKMELPLWYAYSTFGAMLFSSLLGYFFNYRQVILYVNLEDYKIDYGFTAINISKLLAQTVAVCSLPNPYIWWLSLEVAFSVMATCSLHRITTKSFPYINTAKMSFQQLRKKYKIVEIKIRQLIYHKIGTFVLTQTSPLIIYAFLSLSEVTIYGNYLLLSNNILKLFVSIFGSIFPSIGSLVAEGDKCRIISVFKEIYYMRLAIASIVAFSFIELANPFIANWIGKEYLLGELSTILIALLLFIRLLRFAVDGFINAYGLFGDVWAPVAEAVFNVGASICGGFIWGLNGILGGGMVGTVIIIMLWKPIYLCRRGFRIPSITFFAMFGKSIILLLLLSAAIRHMIVKWPVNPSASWVSFLIYAAVSTIFYTLCILTVFYAAFPSFRIFVRRFRKMS